MDPAHRERMRALASLGGHAKAAKMRARTHPEPYSGTFPAFLAAAGMEGPSWAGWRGLWRCLDGLPQEPGDAELFAEATGRPVPGTPPREVFTIAGRRSGKSRIAAARGFWVAAREDYGARLAAGETALVAVLAADRDQARQTLSYVKGLAAMPVFKPLVKRVLRDAVELHTRATVRVVTNSYKVVRGYSLAAVIADELAYWPPSDESANPDTETLHAARPGLANLGGQLLALSSPYARKGALFAAFERFYGKRDAATLVLKLPTARLNPSLNPAVIEAAYADDPAVAAAEYGAEFRTDVQSLFDPAAVGAVTAAGVFEMPPGGALGYVAFVDPSGGSADSFTLAIAHEENGQTVLDCVREVRPRFSPDAVVAEFADVLRAYGVVRVTGDAYGGEWPRERFQAHGITYEVSTRTRSELYLALLPAVNGGRVQLLDAPRLRAQLVQLERRVARGGRESVDHPPGGHDDVANAVAGALVLAGAGSGAEEWLAWARERNAAARDPRRAWGWHFGP